MTVERPTPTAIEFATRSFDALGRKRPLRIDWWMIARAIPGYAQRFDVVVPPAFVAQVAHELLEVACPCGAQPRLEPFRTAYCECGREFVDLGYAVKVANSPVNDRSDG